MALLEAPLKDDPCIYYFFNPDNSYQWMLMVIKGYQYVINGYHAVVINGFRSTGY